MIKIVLSFEDKTLFQKVKQLIERGPLSTSILSETSTTTELINALKRQVPDLVVLGVNADASKNKETLGYITSMYLGLPILAVGRGLDDDMVTHLIKSGAMGYLDETELTTYLMTAVDSLVNRKKNFVSNTVANRVSEEINMLNLKARQKKLSERELQVMKMIGWEMSMEEIADQLAVSVRTVYTYRSRVMEKMGLKSNIAIRRYMLDKQLVEKNF
ncbi:MAG: response regulator transcription factor [Balneolaceae bacterium]|nr:response regulator transcription factor [Balneolaceae bacterium]